MDHFGQALTLAKSDVLRARVEKASICAHKAMILAGGPMDDEERAGLIERYITLCQRYNMTHASERKLAADYFKELK